ncbi:MAG: PaaI family thioesterase [Halopseudomonas sp.]
MSEPNFIDALGIQPQGFVDGQYLIELEVTPQHLNIGGIVHGGVICSLLDTALARSFFLALPEKHLSAATLEMKVNFLGSTKQGKLKAFGRVVNTTKRTAYVEGLVENEQGQLLAKGSATMMIFEEKRVR